MNLVVVAQLAATLLEMLHPVETRILNPRRKALLHPTAFNIGRKRARFIHAADIFLRSSR